MLRRTAMLITLIALGACNDDDSADDVVDAITLRGQFLDSAVHGLDYATSGTTGTTDGSGSYDYVSSSGQISFSLGDIQLGSATVAPVLTPLDLQTTTADTQTSNYGLNLAQFLQTIDNDSDPSNGIQITQAMHDTAAGRSINFSQTPENFADSGSVQVLVADLTATRPDGPRALVERSLANDHMTDTVLDVLDDVREDLLSLVGNATCSESAQCATVPIGHRSCGGPSWFLPYSTTVTNADALETVASEHRRHFRSYVLLIDAVSTCEVLTPPTAMCVDGQCTAENALPSPL